MGWFESVLVGMLQGLTEFLPVSSSGHLVLIQKYLGFKEHNIQLDVVVHMGTLFSVLTVYFKPIKKILIDVLKSIKNKSLNSGSHLFLMIIIGSIPTALIGLTLKDLFESLFSSVSAVGVFLMVTGVILFTTRNKGMDGNTQNYRNFTDIDKVPYWKALIIGVAQGAAIAPGISRSGSTIATAILLGVDRKTASLYSFLLSIPAILGATLLQLKDAQLSLDYIYFLLAGFLSSYVVGLFGLTLLLHFVKKGRLEVFSYYLWCVGILLLI